ncbi:FAD-dependent monooxygenase [Bradyrhizobium sp.]|uniref:FAD-dependent oxidoreductase n=1 Tax=Bradyrhizobium sp. TaxID=376 RepID=UPI0025C5C5E4|nr:FAD-dependent monooxygenase [Bradyrhizobium sp.]
MADSANDLDKVTDDPKTGSAGYRPPVLVVGAGPTGLLLTAELQRRGVPCHLIDAQPGPLHWDRATVVHPRSLEIFESLRLAERFLDAGCRQRGVKIHSLGKVIGGMDLSNCGSTYGFNLGLSEEVTESILTGYLRQQGGEVNRSCRLIGLTQHRDGVLAEIERNGDRYQVAAQWVVGCDGIHSPTRELSGIGFEGHDMAKPWAVFDATLEGWTDSFETTFVYFETVPVILTAIPGHRWRVYLRPSSEDSDLVLDAAFTLRRYSPTASFIGVENPRRFHCHTKIATRFRSGAVFLAGDAAHLCSPAEGHGMNCGLQDAFNLAWKLALVYQGAAAPSMLDSYEAERRPVAEMVAQSGDVMERNLTMIDAAERDSRDQGIKAALADPKKRHHEIVAETELNIEYSRSPIVSGDANSYLGPGDRLPGAIPVQVSDRRPRGLHELTQGAGHTLMLLAGPTAHNSVLLDLHAALQKHTIDSPLFEASVQIGHLERPAADLMGIEEITLLAVRPDGYIGLRSDREHLSAFERYRTLLSAGTSDSLSYSPPQIS